MNIEGGRTENEKQQISDIRHQISEGGFKLKPTNIFNVSGMETGRNVPPSEEKEIAPSSDASRLSVYKTQNTYSNPASRKAYQSIGNHLYEIFLIILESRRSNNPPLVSQRSVLLHPLYTGKTERSETVKI